MAAISRAIDGAVSDAKFVKGRLNVLEKRLEPSSFKLKQQKDVKTPCLSVDSIKPRHQWTRLIAAKYDELGETKVNPLFADPHTHTSRAGAELNAEIVVRGLNGLKKNPLKKFYSEKGKSVGK